MSNSLDFWQECLSSLQREVSTEQFNTWIRPLQVDPRKDHLFILAPNNIVLNWVKEQFIKRICELIKAGTGNRFVSIFFEVGSKYDGGDEENFGEFLTEKTLSPSSIEFSHDQPAGSSTALESNTQQNTLLGGCYKTQESVFSGLNVDNKNAEDSFQSRILKNNLNPAFSFEKFVIGKSNQLAYAAAAQVVENIGKAYNPLFIYGGSGLGKTHLMHAVGNEVVKKYPNARVYFLPAERFVLDMVTALRLNKWEAFKAFYRQLNILLIDDVQFLAGKGRSQEEFFHTFNALYDEEHQIVLTCDKYPKEIGGLEERLKSRFGWGLTVSMEPPDLETRVAILLSKAEQSTIHIPSEVAFFIAKRIQSNVRELEGALKRVIANSVFTGQPITLDFAREALKDLLAVQAKLVSIENIQKTVAEYYKLKKEDLLSKNRARFIARARQIAMSLAKELTQHSLPEIGKAFNGRDHTTVIHACRKVKELIEQDFSIKEDYLNLLRILST